MGSRSRCMFSMLLLLAMTLGCLSMPSKPVGFTFGHGKASAPVQLEAVIDLLCPFCRDAYPALKQLAQAYDPDQFRLRFILNPLPFHQQAFTVAQSAFAISNALGDSQSVRWLETMYANQEKFYNAPTMHLSNAQVTEKLGQLAMLTFPKLTKDQWEQEMANPDTNTATRTSWGYVVARGLVGTPKYVLNGMPLKEADSSWTVEQWRHVIDPLVAAASVVQILEDEDSSFWLENSLDVKVQPPPPPHVQLSDRKVYKLSANGIGNLVQATELCQKASPMHRHRPCEYLPGQLMCCLVNEACLSLVGCSALT